MQIDNQNLSLIKPEIRSDNVQALIVSCWNAKTAKEWRESQTVLLALMKIASGDFFNDIYFLYDIADQRETMAWNEEMEAYAQAGPV